VEGLLCSNVDMIERVAHYARRIPLRRIPLWLGIAAVAVGILGLAYVLWWTITGKLPQGFDPTMSRQEYVISYLVTIGAGVVLGAYGYVLLAEERDSRSHWLVDFVTRAKSWLLVRGRRGQSTRLREAGLGANAPKSTSHQYPASTQAEQASRVRLPQQSQPRRVVKVTEQIRESAGLNPEQVSPVADVLRKVLDDRDREHRRREIRMLVLGALLGLLGNMLTLPLGRLFGT
jgi:hypothetical protein